MTYNLFIDDERDPIDVTWGSVGEKHIYKNYEWIIARNWDEVLELVVTLGFPERISFDHDLGEEKYTGYDIAKKLTEMIMDGIPLPDNFIFHVHSKNPVGSENIKAYMQNFIYLHNTFGI